MELSLTTEVDVNDLASEIVGTNAFALAVEDAIGDADREHEHEDYCSEQDVRYLIKGALGEFTAPDEERIRKIVREEIIALVKRVVQPTN